MSTSFSTTQLSEISLLSWQELFQVTGFLWRLLILLDERRFNLVVSLS